jgi:hypothetical protein
MYKTGCPVQQTISFMPGLSAGTNKQQVFSKENYD